MKFFNIQALALFQRFTSSKPSSFSMENKFAHANDVLMIDSNVRAAVREAMGQSSENSGPYNSEMKNQIIKQNLVQIAASEKRLINRIEELETHLSRRIALKNMMFELLMCILVTVCLIHYINDNVFNI